MQPTVLIVEGDDQPAAPAADPPVVVVTSEPDTTAVALAEQVGALTVEVEHVSEVADVASETAVKAMQAADAAFALAVEPPMILEPVTEAYELPDDEPQEDSAPAKVHWAHRTLKSYFGGS